MIIGIDNGYGYIKTSNTISLNGVNKLISKPAILDNVLGVNGEYYTVGESRIPYLPDKTVTQEHYLGTLAAIAREMKLKGWNRGEVTLAQGLPYQFFDTQREKFKKYMLQKPDVRFSYERADYRVKLIDALIYPQCLPIICQIPGNGKKIGVDIGSGTVDVVVYLGNKLVRMESFTLPHSGTIFCMEQIKKAFVEKYSFALEEWLIQEIMINGIEGSDLPKEYHRFVEGIIAGYIKNKIILELEGRGIDSRFMRMVFCGGGASLVKRYGDYDSNLVTFEENIHANATGYENLTKALQQKNRTI
ncbi:MAG: ParM/StbA family protein [Ruminococcus sp.]|nr:ParM/StbA family protein [Ruminococcus sp.]